MTIIVFIADKQKTLMYYLLILKTKIMILFKSKWTKWKPITIYCYEYQDFILLGKLNTKNGDVKFKSVRAHGRTFYTQAYNLFNTPFDATKQLLELFSYEK